MAGGFTIKVDQIDKFKKFIFKKFSKLSQNLTKQKPLYFDSVIAPTAINLEFYHKINTLAPFDQETRT